MTTRRTSSSVALYIALALPAFAGTVAPAADIPPPGEILSTLGAERPRIIADGRRFEEIARAIEREPLLRDWYRALRKDAENILEAPPVAYDIPDGLRLLSVSRRVVRRVYTLGLLHRLEDDRKYVERAWRDLEAAASFPDWNPRHFLDTAEMTHGFAVAHDWFHDAFDESRRNVLRGAIIEKGLRPALAAYEGRSPHGWWTRARHNWNQVSNGGVAIGALSVAEEDPELCGRVLHEALRRLPQAMERFAPDGAWDEGPGYWRYATEYNVAILAALETSLGTDFGLSEIEGFAEAGTFPLHVTGPFGRTFNFADGGSSTIRAPHLFWLARRFGRPSYAWYQKKVADPHPLDLVWRRPVPPDFRTEDQPLHRRFRGAEVASLRSAWDDPEALFLAFKGGDNRANHSNLDLGTFVLDALGERWALDLGADDYNLPGYWERGARGRRWSYYRMRAESHNTLVIDPGSGPDQDPEAHAEIVRFTSSGDRALGVVDLSAAYPEARRALRGFRLAGRKVTIQDEVETDGPADVWWFLHTRAAISIENGGREAILEEGGARLHARILHPPAAAFRSMPARPLESSPRPEGQRSNRGVSKLAIELADVESLRLTVELSPLRAGEEPGAPEEVMPLDEW